MMVTTFSRATVGLATLLTCIWMAIVASTQAADIETPFSVAQQQTSEERAWSSDNYYGSQTLPNATSGQDDSIENRSSGQYQRGKAIGINIVDAGQGKVVITYVHPDSPAEQSGLQQGDAIRRVDGRRVSSTLDVIQHIGQLPAHDRVNLEVERAQRMRFFQVRLAPPPKAPVRGRSGGPEVQFSSQRTVEDASGSYAYQAQYGARPSADGYPAAETSGYSAATQPRSYLSPPRDDFVPSPRVLMQEISELRRQLSEVRQELAELRKKVEDPSPQDRPAQDLQPRDLSPRSEEFPYDDF